MSPFFSMSNFEGRPKWKFWDGSACGNPLRFVIPFWSTTTRPPQEPPNGSSPRIGSLLKFGVELGDLFSLLWCLQWSPPTVIVTMRMIIPLHRAKRKKTFCSSSWSFTFNCSGGIIPSVVSLQHRQKSFSCAFHWCATNVIHFWKIKFNWTWKSDLQERLFWQPYLADVADVLFACGSFLPRWKISSHSEDTWSALFPHRNREIPVVNSQGSWKRNWLRHLVHSKFPRKYLGVQWNSYHSAMESWVPPRWSFSRRGWLPPLNLEIWGGRMFFSRLPLKGIFFVQFFGFGVSHPRIHVYSFDETRKLVDLHTWPGWVVREADPFVCEAPLGSQ